MTSDLPDDINKIIVDKAKALGASLAGIADVSSVKNSPSHENQGRIKWDDKARALLVMAVLHSEAEPELDWWDGRPGRTDRIRELNRIGKEMKQWLKSEFDIESNVLSYSIGRGGIFLKDAAVLAGLGCIGKNNILVTPEYGPRVRLAVMTLKEELSPPAPVDFDPCEGCGMPCRAACPQDAFEDGRYDVNSCRKQMSKDERDAVKDVLKGIVIKYCRDCELACPVGGGR